MPLKQKHIDELKQIYLRKTGQSLSDQEAWAMGQRLIRMFAVLWDERSVRTSSDLPSDREV